MKFFFIEIFYPIFLSASFFALFTSLVYEGPKEERVSSVIESHFFEWSKNHIPSTSYDHTASFSIVPPQDRGVVFLSFVFLFLCSLFSFGFFSTLFLFFGLSFLLPIINLFLLHFFRCYVPIFDLLYGIFWMITMSIFTKISLDSFLYWSIVTKQESDIKLAESKHNFISLLSHNLNTPIAKMSVLLNLLQQHVPEEAPLFKSMFEDLAYMQISIKILLVQTAIDESRLIHEPSTVEFLSKEFFRTTYSSLSRMGLDISVLCSSEREDLALLPLRFDRKVITTVLACLAILISWFDHNKKCQIYLTVSEKEEHGHVSHILMCEGFSFQKKPIQMLKAMFEGSGSSVNIPVLMELCVNLILSVKKYYDGDILIQEDENHMTIIIKPKTIGETSIL